MAVPLLLAAGAGLSFFGRMKAASAEAQQLKNQSILLQKSGQDILDFNEFNTEAIRDQVKQVQGSAETKFAQSGFATDIESLADIAAAGAKEINIRTEQAHREAASRSLEALHLRRNARNTKKAGTIGAIGSILGSFGGLG